MIVTKRTLLMNIEQKSTMVNLIADIGGTNIRLAQATANLGTNTRDIEICDIETYQCKEFSSLADVVY